MALTPSRCALDNQPNTPAGRTILELLPNGLGTDEGSVFSPVLADDPGQASFDRRGGLVEVIPVQAHPGFETEAVAGTQTSELDWVLRQEFGDLYGL